MEMMTASARFALRDDENGNLLGVFADLDGFFVGKGDGTEAGAEHLTPLTFDIVGSELSLRFAETRNLYVMVLGVDGNSIGEYYVADARLGAVTEADRMQVSGLVSSLPRSGAGEVWEVWRSGRPRVSGEWAKLPVPARDAWLEVVGKYWFATVVDRFPSPRRQTVILEGAHVQNPASFFCAFGEAVNGPGGYFGWNLAAFADCLGGGFGVTGPFTLSWRNFDVASSYLTSPLLDGRPYLNVILDILHNRQVKVVPDGESLQWIYR